ncbi:MAG TPA: Hsp70 family protein, partial [Polyangiaceae bacterium]|nr:Hsp70 family protein [Polyangiaceae bacterium]
MSARHVVGIDLGTTHTAVAIAPIASEGTPAIDVFSLPQLVARATLDAQPLLPSFLYFAHESEGAQALPWDAKRGYVVGEYARSRGTDAPARLVSSAKSWLSHAGIDRRLGNLPVGAPDDIEKISPVEASFRYLEHVAEAYDAAYATANPDLALAAQEIVLTVPASFDPAARELTVEAALAAGLDRVTLLEEPQSALYAWIAARASSWRKDIRPGDVILVIDVGGGTTDFSAIAAVDEGGALALSRLAVGDHILLGGDNMDLALAHRLRQKLEAGGKEVDKWQMSALTHASRQAKERMLSDGSLGAVPITVAARGSALLGGGLRTEL